MSRDFMCGTWQISKCFLNEQVERLGLEGIQFRLDHMGDITWFNDLSHLTAATGPEDFEDISESADVLFSCETYEVLPDTTVHGPELVFIAFAGYSIQFKVDSLCPDEDMLLHCDGWYTLQCSRVCGLALKDASGSCHDGAFTLLDALNNAADLYADCTIESADGRQFRVHSSILRLSGFDSSSCCTMSAPPVDVRHHQSPTRGAAAASGAGQSADTITIAIHPPSTPAGAAAASAAAAQHHHHHHQLDPGRLAGSTKAFLLSPKLLISPTLEMFHLPSKLASNLSNSFNCLANAASASSSASSTPATARPDTSDAAGHQQLHRTQISTSDSNLKSSVSTAAASRPNIFTFADVGVRQPRVCPPLSPYRSKSPLWSAGSAESSPPPLSPLTPTQVLQALPAEDLAAVLHWLYAECLPPGLDEERLLRLIAFAEGVSRLGKMAESGQAYLGMVRLKKLVVNVVTDVHNCLNRIIELLRSVNHTPHDPLALWTVCKCAARELCVITVKVLQFSNIFARDRPLLQRHLRHDIIKFVRSRLPIFIAQGHQVMQHVAGVLAALTLAERRALVTFLVPEVADTLALMRDIVAQLKHSLRSMYDGLKSECQAEQRRRSSGNDDDDAATTTRTTTPNDGRAQQQSKNLRVVLYKLEMKRMREVYGRISTALEIVDEKRTSFDQMSAANRAETIRQNLEQLMAAMPRVMKRIEYCAGNLESLQGWKEFKFFFKVATNQINGMVAKLLDHRIALTDTATHLCLLVARPPFTDVLLDIGLLDAASAASILDAQAQTPAQAAPPSHFRTGSRTAEAKLNLAQHCSDSPRQSCSSLAKNALRLLHSGQHSDMEFEIIVMPMQPQTDDDDEPDDKGENGATAATAAQPCAAQVHIFRAHRVVVATRCEWFHKALSSGMQESIHRRITIHDTSPVIFRRLLLHLYGAPVDRTVGAEQLCELWLLADRFSVDALKDICESTLRALIDDASVLCLLALADRLCATVLKANCFAYISQHPEVVRAEVFQDLPRPVQCEVEDVLLWRSRIPEPWRERRPSKKRSHKSSPRSAT